MTKLSVVINDINNNPSCAHGPTLLFRKTCVQNNEVLEEFYSCSACRDRKFCNFYVKKGEQLKNTICITPIVVDHRYYSLAFYKISKLKPKYRGYCTKCNILLSSLEFNQHTTHNIIKDLTDVMLHEPTQFLPSLSNDKQEAQYFFSKAALNFFQTTLKSLQITKVICMGTPRLHEYLSIHRSKFGINTILLDFDKRFYNFYDKNQFFWYNMFNNHFFGLDESRESFNKFLKNIDNDKICLVIDPPFGCRTEPLISTIKNISFQYRLINNDFSILSVFWVFPYYMEPYITNLMPEMEMLDYKVNYTNHSTYHDREKGRKQGSPVRIFTNIDISKVKLPADEGYRHCGPCNKWVDDNNLHCNICKTCPSKNGDTYIHCQQCALCVKPNYVHCNTCNRCTQKMGHNCLEYQKNLNCWICRQKGHQERHCTDWLKLKGFKISKTRNNHKICLICNMPAHNEKMCLLRKKYLKENSFLGSITNIFNKTTEYN